MEPAAGTDPHEEDMDEVARKVWKLGNHRRHWVVFCAGRAGGRPSPVVMSWEEAEGGERGGRILEK